MKKNITIFFIPFFLLIVLVIFSIFYTIPSYLVLPSQKNDNIITATTTYSHLEKGEKVFITDSSNNIEEWGEIIDKQKNILYIASPNTRKMSSFVLVRINAGYQTIIETIMKEIIK